MDETERLHTQILGEHLTVTGISDIGFIRDENQDAIYLDEKGRFVLLADGMGGHERGAEASQTIINILKDFFQPGVIENELKDITDTAGVPAEVNVLFSLIDKGIRKSNNTLYSKNRSERIERYMGSTLVGLIVTDNMYVTWFHVGDSRLYRWRGMTLNQLTEDHSAYAEWLHNGCVGEEPGKNIVTRAIGPKEGIIPNIDWAKGKKDDIYILCSDGLSDMVGDDVISNIILNADSVNGIAVNLLNAALDAGGHDNISIIVCRLI